jgi:hypothetical protein
MRIESSIMTSLSELRAIEQQRITDERVAVDRARTAELEAKRAAEQAVRDAEERRVREEREALMRIEQARLDAEREARMRVEAAEAAERTRLQAQLDQQRMVEELELKRAEIAKKRPTWMLAVTGAAVVAMLGLGWYAYERQQDSNRADEQRAAADIAKKAAIADAIAARQELERLAQQMDEQDARIAQAEKALVAAETKAERDRVASEIRKANEEKARIRELQRKAKERQDKIDRNTVIDVSTCLHGSIDCIDGKPKKK